MTNQLLAELEMANKKIEEKDKEIERLSKEVDMWNRKYNEQIDIINELENFIETYAIPEFNISEEPTRYFMETKIILDRIKELKEGK